LGVRFGNKQAPRPQPNPKYQHVKSQVDHGMKQNKHFETDEDSLQIVTKLRGENFSRITSSALARFLQDG